MFDLHIHTTLSECCNDPKMQPAEIIPAAADAGLSTIGFTNHVWDSVVPGASDWYRPQTVEHICKIRKQLPQETHGVRVLVGCETEYLGGGQLGLSHEAMKLFDYILVPATHFHMKNYVAPTMSNCKDVALLMKQRFDEITGLAIPNCGIAHPFLPLGYLDDVDEICAALSDQALLDSFDKARQADVSIEITTEFFPSLQAQPKFKAADDIFVRILLLAKQAGCKFHLASDAHRFDQIGLVNKLKPIITKLKLDQSDFWLG